MRPLRLLPAFRRLGLPGLLKPKQAGRDNEAARSKRHQRAPHTPSVDTLNETLEVRLKRRIERLEATIGELEDDKRRLRES